MADAIANAVLTVVGAACIIIWITGLVRWDGKKQCKPGKDCEDCPFPPCENKNKKEKTP